ncbi:MAG TPA: PQQ-binding-like beta-propeller repeat protein, partial [Gemmatimonadaceae bacterium]
MSYLAFICIFAIAACGGATTTGSTTSSASGSSAAADSGASVPAATHQDWTRFGWDVGRSGVAAAPTGIGASNVASLHRQQVNLDGTVDASPIYLHAATVGGGTHDVFFVTTTYGKTIAIDADAGTILWEYTPPGTEALAGSRQITNSTPAADPDRTAIYAASPDGKIEKLAVADGHELWSTAITL